MRFASLFHSSSLVRSAVAGTGHATASHAVPSAELASRAAAIRRKETLLWWMRALVIPGFMLYGLVVLRPTEGHFLRYLAERRHLEPSFNQLFPPLTTTQLSPDATATATHQSSPSQTDANSFAKDKTWLEKKLHVEVKDEEDEARVARKRLLFARDRSFSESFSDEYGVVLVKPAEERQRELELLALHPPMHVLRQQLDHLAAVSRDYHRKCTGENNGPGAPPPPPLELQFRDRALFATAAMAFHDAAGEEVKRIRFVGICGMMWKQVTP